MKQRHITLFASIVGLVLSLFAPSSASSEDVLDYAHLLRRITDLDRLPYLEEGVVSKQFSSYNRASRYDREKGVCVGMDANFDGTFTLTVHAGPGTAEELAKFKIPAATRRYAFGDLEWMLDPLERTHVFFLPRDGVRNPRTKPPEKIAAAIPGPGCIYRIWSANPMGTIRFYFDGGTEPLELDFKSLFTKGASDPDRETLARRHEWPFVRPFTYRRSPSTFQPSWDKNWLASDCYLPIPFAKSCIITLDQPFFYHFGYKTFPEGTRVETFRLPLDDDAVRAFDEVALALLDRGKDPKPKRPRTASISKTVTLEPGAEIVLADLRGPRIVQALHARLSSKERYAHSKVLLRAFFDDEAEPCITSPLVNFFGTGFEPRDYRSLVLGYINEEGYCYFPMPFRKRARFVITNEGRMPAELSYRIVHAPVDGLPPNTMLFKCKYRREEVCKTFDYPFLECAGPGRFLGMALSIDDAWRGWWGEGDEKIWVDDDVFPSFFGTGSEDFFGDAWGIRTLQESFFGCSFNEANAAHSWTCCYRYMVPDDIPFYKKFRATIENYSEHLGGIQAIDWDEDYVSTAYWYQMPGGTDFFTEVPVAKRRPWGKVPAPPVVEAEDVLAGAQGLDVAVVDDEGLPNEFSRGRALKIHVQEAGTRVSFLGPDLILEGPYLVRVHTQPGTAPSATFELSTGGVPIGSSPPDFGRKDFSTIGAAMFPKGRSRLELRFTSTGEVVLDALQLVPARQIPNAFEAEKARRVDSGRTATTVDTGVLLSGGKALRFRAKGPGDSIELEIAIPPGNWYLSAGLTRGPSRGDYRVFVNGEERGHVEGFSPSVRVEDGVRLGTLKGRDGKAVVRFVCAGKSPKATGQDLGLDYFRLSPILVENAIEGETAKVVDVKDGRLGPQMLDAHFSGESHLWFLPNKVGASFVWPLKITRAGRYALAVYFTKSWDYAIVRVRLNGKVLGEFDTYAPTVAWGGRTGLGAFDFKPGTQRLEFEIAGRNEKSRGILMGIDCLSLERK